jgi:hypothetical protein
MLEKTKACYFRKSTNNFLSQGLVMEPIDLPMQLRMASNLQSSTLSLLSAGIVNVHHVRLITKF